MEHRVCPGCGETPGDGDFCGSCGLNLSEAESLPTRNEWRSTSSEVALSTSLSDAAPVSRRKAHVTECLAAGRTPGIAYVLSALLPGLGHFYFELLGSGILFLFALGFLTWAGYLIGGLAVGVVGYVLVWLAALIDLNLLCTEDEPSTSSWR